MNAQGHSNDHHRWPELESDPLQRISANCMFDFCDARTITVFDLMILPELYEGATIAMSLLRL